MVPSFVGYRSPPLPGGVHRGMPSPYLTLVFSLVEPIPFLADDGAAPVVQARLGTPVGGLHTRPVLMDQRHDQVGIQLAVHPLASRVLFGLPAGELHAQIVELGDVVGGHDGWPGRLAEASRPADAAALVRSWLSARVRDGTPVVPRPEIGRAWQLIVGSGGRRRIGDVAREVGWSRRHLTAQLRREIGVGAKDLARLARFDRSRRMLLSGSAPLAEVAADAGYADQAHFTAEWRDFAGCTPGRWVAEELGTLRGPTHVHDLERAG